MGIGTDGSTEDRVCHLQTDPTVLRPGIPARDRVYLAREVVVEVLVDEKVRTGICNNLAGLRIVMGHTISTGMVGHEAELPDSDPLSLRIQAASGPPSRTCPSMDTLWAWLHFRTTLMEIDLRADLMGDLPDTRLIPRDTTPA